MSTIRLANVPVDVCDRRVADQDAEAVGVLLDVGEQCERRLLEQPTRMVLGQRTLDHAEQLLHLPVDDDGVQTLLAAEVLVDDRLGDAGLGRDLLDRGRLEPALGEERAADLRAAARDGQRWSSGSVAAPGVDRS